MPAPALQRLEEPARQRLEAQREDLDRLLSDADGHELATAFGEMGRLYLAYEFPQAATACFQNATALRSEEFRWHYLLAVTQQIEGQFDEAAASLSRGLELRPGDLPALLRRGQAELDREQLDAAAASFRRALEQKPNATAHFGLGRIAALEPDLTAAIQHFTKALSLQPEASAVHHALGLAYRDAGDSQRAVAHLEKGGARRPSFADPLVDALAELHTGPQLHLALGNRSHRAGRLDEALAHYRRAVELDPRHPLARHNLGSTLAMTGATAEALPHLKQAVELDPKNRDARFDLATALSSSGDFQAAVEEFSNVLTIDPEDRAARRRRAAVRAALGELEPAQEELERLASSDPDDAETRLHLAAVQMRRRQFGEAAETFATVAALEPQRVEAYLGAVQARLAGRQYRLARQFLETSLETVTQDLPLRHALARLLATCPDPSVRDGSKALKLAEEVFARRRTLEYGETVAMALAEVGRVSDAAEWLRRLIAEAEKAKASPAVVERLKSQLARYESGEPVRLP